MAGGSQQHAALNQPTMTKEVKWNTD
jgi:hypothetical protein